MKTRLTVAALVVTATSLSLGPPAHGSDQRPCVSKREFNGAKGLRQADMEQRWEVTGLGKRRVIVPYGAAILYPRCGYNRHEAWYAVQYGERGDTLIDWKADGATLHGRP